MSRGLLADLADWLRRRPVALAPGQSEINHSADLRLAILALAATELIAEGLLDFILPVPLRVVHVLWMVLIAVLALGIIASIARRPHLVDDDSLLLQAGSFGEISIPLAAIASLRLEMRSTTGFGLRQARDDADTAVCSIGGTTQVVIDLDVPLPVRLRNGTTVNVRQVHLAADYPSKAVSRIRVAVAEAKAEHEAQS
jgi:hypothetical protein